jgi:hypothetical protein
VALSPLGGWGWKCNRRSGECMGLAVDPTAHTLRVPIDQTRCVPALWHTVNSFIYPA